MKRLIASGVCAGLLILGACGSNDLSSSSTTATTAKPAASATTTTEAALLTEAKACDAFQDITASSFGESAHAPDYGWGAYSAGLHELEPRIHPDAPIAALIDTLSTQAAKQATSTADVPAAGDAMQAASSRCEQVPGTTTTEKADR